ncbi:DUF748 domain-containing protein [Roseateles sp.]|uniref:DUF748 domain-containing protein n=1 Tax=Roseateles sp. TaxID=1971397 RepID=UPI003BA40D6E
MTATPSPRAHARPRRWPVWVISGFAAFLLLLLALWFWLPKWVQGSGARMASEALGRPVSIAEFEFSPWRLGVMVGGLRVAGASAQSEPLLEVERIEAALSLRSLWFRSPVLESLSVTRPVLRLTRVAGGQYDIDDLLQRFAASGSPKKPDSEPAELALYNISLQQGQVIFNDRPVERQHVLSDFSLEIPFISTLDADIKVQVQPQLSGRFNGVAFGGQGKGLPFAERREASLDFELAGFDLSPYVDYMPNSLPLRLQQGKIDAKLSMQFQQPRGEAPWFAIRGALDLKHFNWSKPSGEPWLAWRGLHIDLQDVQPLRRLVSLGGVQWKGLDLAMARDARGQVWLPGQGDQAASGQQRSAVRQASQTELAAQKKHEAKVGGAASSRLSEDGAWRVSFTGFDLSEGRISWQDAALPSPVALNVSDLRLKLGAGAWPLKKDLPMEWSWSLQADERAKVPSRAAAKRAPSGMKQAALAIAPEPTLMSGEGSVGPEALRMSLQVAGLDLLDFAPYLRPYAAAQLGGRLGFSAQLNLADPLQAEPASRLVLGVRDLALSGLTLSELDRRDALLRLGTLALDRLDIEPGKQRLEAGTLKLVRPALALWRNPQGQWSYQSLLPKEPTNGRHSASKSEPVVAVPVSAAAVNERKASRPWSMSLQRLTVEQGSVRATDEAAPSSVVALRIDQIGLNMADLAWPASGGTMPLSLNLKLGALSEAGTKSGRSKDEGKSKSDVDAKAMGSLQWQGQVSLEPLSAKGRLRLDRMPLQLARGYLDPAWGLHLQRLELGLRSQLQVKLLPAGLQAQVSGDVLLAELKLQQARQVDGELRIGEDLLDWQALKLNGFNLGVQPGQAPQLSVAEAGLSDFYARIIIDEAGRINLRELGAGESDGKMPASQAAAWPAAIPASGAASAAAKERSIATAAVQAPGSAPTSPVSLSIGQLLIDKGRVDFTDRFVRPNYSARLTELQGSLGAVSSSKAELAPLNLRGRVAGTGLLDISGQLNPLGKPLMLDITAAATDIELAPMSPYATKYIGYALERGKLSSKVHYKVDAAGALSANNQIILNQLTFGEKVDSPDATQLPVLFAVALLKDKNGVIDVDLPISGSINDPQFSVGGLIWKVIVNLFSKAISAPFSLLSGSGETDLSRLEFVPGSAQAASAESLNKVAQMLADRPGLALTITAWADPLAERGALQERQLKEALLAERRRELQRQRTTSTFTATQEESGELGPLSEAESTRLLKVVYGSSKLPNKPRNVLGMAKDIPTAEMRRLLLDSMVVSEEQVRQLALDRGIWTRDALIAKGLSNERLFLGAPQLVRAKADAVQTATPSGPAAWAPYAELKLSGR